MSRQRTSPSPWWQKVAGKMTENGLFCQHFLGRFRERKKGIQFQGTKGAQSSRNRLTNTLFFSYVKKWYFISFSWAIVKWLESDSDMEDNSSNISSFEVDHLPSTVFCQKNKIISHPPPFSTRIGCVQGPEGCESNGGDICPHLPGTGTICWSLSLRSHCLWGAIVDWTGPALGYPMELEQ